MGHNLSGGQKSRISLARAIYKRDASVVLIDGTLSSLDAKVSHDVFKNAIKNLCRDKLVLMVTYDLDQAASMDKVIYLDEGKKGLVMTQSQFVNSDMFTKR